MDLMTLVAKLILDSSEYEQGLGDAEKSAGGIGSKLAGGAKLAAAGFMAAGTAAAGAVTAITKSAISGYADLEQLEGGIETLFGDSAQKVIADANNAFKTAGMNANQYMETSIQSAAAMINSLGGDQAKAAEMMNMSITDMADNVNKMGTNMESVQDAYRGFSRGNFTMLDNLALGFSGTKEGMQQLLDKAEELSGVKYDINSYSDIVQAIHEVQTEMGITGTTAKEASETISGSLASFKTAWSNLVTGFADGDADLDNLISNVVDTAETLFGNILPVAEKVLGGIAEFVEKIAPVMAEKLPEVIDTVLPKILDAGNKLLSALISVLPETGMKIITAVIDALTTALPEIATVAVQAISEFANGITEALPQLIPAAIEAITAFVNALLDNADLLIDAALELSIGLAEGLIEAIPIIVEKMPIIISHIIDALLKAIPKIAAAGVKLIGAIVKNLPAIIASIIKAVPKIIASLVKSFGAGNAKMAKAGLNLIKGLGRGLVEGAAWVIQKARELAASVLGVFTHMFDEHSPSKVMIKYGRFLDEGLAMGIEDSVGVAQKAMENLGNAISEPMDASVGFDSGFGDETVFDVLSTPDTASRTDAPRDVTVILQLDRTQLARTVFRLNNEESQRVGVNLAGGFA